MKSGAAQASCAQSGENITIESLGSKWLHVKWHYNCYFLYAEYYFETWVTKTSDPNSERIPVKSLTLRWRHGSTTGEEGGVDTAMVAKDDRVYATDVTCDTDICVIAIANDGSGSWGNSSPAGCAWKS
jgi:hypothetical protein